MIGVCNSIWSLASHGGDIQSRALAILARYGADAHLWLPGAAVPVLGAELAIPANMSLVQTVDLGGGRYRIQPPDNSYAGIQLTGFGNPVNEYLFTFTIESFSLVGGGVVVEGAPLINRRSVGTFSCIAKPTNTNLVIKRDGSQTNCVISGISIRQVTGYTTLSNGVDVQNFLDSTGSDLLNYASEVDQPVGLVIDSEGALGGELVTNGDNEIAVANGIALGQRGVVTRVNDRARSGVWSAKYTCNDATSGDHLTTLMTVPANTAVRVSIWVYNPTGNFASLRLIDSADGSWFTTADTTKDNWIQLTGIRPAKATSWSLAFGNQGSVSALNQVYYFDDVSVKPLTGTLALQATTANKPILRRGRVNYALFSHDIPNAGWSKTNTTAVGTLISRTSTTLPGYTGNTTLFNVPIGTKLTVAVRVSAGAVGGFFGIRMQGTYPNKADMLVNLANGSFTTAESTYVINGAEVVADGGAWLCVMRVTIAGSVGARIYFGPTDNSVATASWEVATPVLCDANMHGVARFDEHVTAAQIIAAGGIPATGAAAASSTVGPYWWEFDGGNDTLTLSAVDINPQNDFFMSAAISPNADSSGTRRILSWSGAVSRSELYMPPTSGVLNFRVTGDSGADTFTGGTGKNHFGVSSVVSARKVGDSKVARSDGVQIGTTNTTATSAGTNNVANLGSIAGGTLFRGGMYAALLIKGVVSDSDMLTLEKWLAKIQGRIL